MDTKTRIKKAEKIVAKYTMAAAATGAIPVPAASVAIVGENAAMVSHVSSVMGEEVTVPKVVSTMGTLGMVNTVGRTLFVEAGKLLSWGTGNPWAAGLLMTVGSATAGVQTYIIGNLAIEIGKNKGGILDHKTASQIRNEAKNNYRAFIAANKKKSVNPREK